MVQLTTGEPIVEGIVLELQPGEILGVVGESGSGKTTMAMALLGYAGPGVRISQGSLTLAGTRFEVHESLRSVRGSVISYVPQNPGRSLNPALRIRDSIQDVIDAHSDTSDPSASVPEMLQTVGLPSTDAFARRFPHQLSGGQQQRVCIAMALASRPAVIVLDEPTTGLDVVTQDVILSELLRLRRERGVSMVYVTHDLAVVAQIADRIAVMYAGRVVEQGPRDAILTRPSHPYTRGLLSSIPDHVSPHSLEPMPGIAAGVRDRPHGCAFALRCPQRTEACIAAMPGLTAISPRHDVRCLHWEQTPPILLEPLPVRPRGARPRPVIEVSELSAVHRSRRETVTAAEGVSFSVAAGECLALVGESGSGKTTIARSIAGLHPIDNGQLILNGEVLDTSVRRRTPDQRRRLQMIFQNPADALNPRRDVRSTISRPAVLLRGLNRREAEAEAMRTLESVRLPERVARRYPGELSGGECQRVAIARALAADPDVILCDEITSALDVSVQAAVLELLNRLRTELGLALVFITHDLGVVASIADEVLVLESGRPCERGRTEELLRSPQQPYTKQLLDAAPSLAKVDRRDASDRRTNVVPAQAPLRG